MSAAHAALASEAVWLSALRAAGRSHRTLEHYDYCTRTLRDWRSANDHLSTLTRIEALAYVRHLTENRAPAGALSHLRCGRSTAIDSVRRSDVGYRQQAP